MYRFHSKLECVLKAVKVTDNEKTLAYHKICPFSVNYTFIMFYDRFSRLERLGGDKRSSLFAFVVRDEEKKFFMSFAPGDLQD